MEVEFADKTLERLATDASFTMGLPAHVAQKYRDRVSLLLSVPDERALRALRGSLDYKKRKGGKDNERQMRLNRQYRIRLEVVEGDEGKVMRIIGAGNFHD